MEFAFFFALCATVHVQAEEFAGKKFLSWMMRTARTIYSSGGGS